MTRRASGHWWRWPVGVGMLVVVGLGAVWWSTTRGDDRAPTNAGTAEGTDDGPRQITVDEADRLARVLSLNQQDGGARFRLRMASLDGAVLEMDGSVDWEDHVGQATVRSTRAPQVGEVRWGGDVVLERIAGLGEVVGDPRVAWAARPAATAATSDLDLAMHLLVGLANDRAENAVLLTQDEGVRRLRTATVRGIDVDVFAHGPQTRYWVRAGTSELVRMEGGAAGDAHTIVVDLVERGPQDVAWPDALTVMERATIAARVGAGG